MNAAPFLVDSLASGALLLEHVVERASELSDVVGFDRHEGRDPQLVAAELAVGLGVDDAVGPQGLGYGCGVDGVGEVCLLYTSDAADE